MGRIAGSPVSSLQTLVDAFDELAALNRSALQKLEEGLQVDQLEGVFARKAALSGLIDTQAMTGLKSDPEGLERLLAAQKQAAESEAHLLAKLQGLVSNFETLKNRSIFDKANPPGSRWESLG